jgi:hypothetical protein
MNLRFLVIATALLAAGAAAAEPPKTPAKDAAQPARRPAPVILASADQLPTPAPGQTAQPPVKHRAARVTTCRCGDQVDEQPEQ